MVEKITGKNKLKRNGSGYNDPTAYKAIMNVGGATVMNMYRGDIFYTENTVGNETPVTGEKSRLRIHDINDNERKRSITYTRRSDV